MDCVYVNVFDPRAVHWAACAPAMHCCWVKDCVDCTVELLMLAA